MIEKETVIPSGWKTATLGEITSKLVDGSHNPPSKQNSGLPMLSAVNIDNNHINFSSYRLISESEFETENKRTRIAPGDVLLTIVGAIGRAAVVPENMQCFTLQRSVAVFAPILVDSKFLMYQFESPDLANYFKKNARGTAQKGIYLKVLGGTKVLVPPLNEQKRIVAKIEELFSELDKGIESLKTARAQLKIYRQAVLKHAFEGKLTADWRKKNKDKLEPADKLLARIKREREEHYQQQLAARQKNAFASKPRQIKDFSDLGAEELTMLVVLPQGWAWAKVISLFDVISGGTPKGIEETKGTDIPFYKVADMNSVGNETFMRIAAIYLSESERAELGLTCYPAGTIIFPKRGGAILTNKKRMLSQPSCFDLNIMGVISTAPGILTDYLWYWFQKLDLAKIFDGSNIPQINNKNVDPLPFPLCSVDEQKEIIKLLSAHISAIESTEKEIETNLQKSEALRQAIFKKAFTGRLVAQDPADEPASVLLERISAEKEAQFSKKKPKEKRRAA